MVVARLNCSRCCNHRLTVADLNRFEKVPTTVTGEQFHIYSFSLLRLTVQKTTSSFVCSSVTQMLVTEYWKRYLNAEDEDVERGFTR